MVECGHRTPVTLFWATFKCPPVKGARGLNFSHIAKLCWLVWSPFRSMLLAQKVVTKGGYWTFAAVNSFGSNAQEAGFAKCS